MRKKILFLILLAVAVLPGLAAAATLETMADAAAKTALYVASGVVVVLWVVTGILFLSAQGDPAKLKSARTALLTAIAGTVILIIADMGAIAFTKSIFKL